MISRGLYTALVTPFNPDGKIDEKGFRQNVLRQKKAGVDGVVVFGATGEGSLLTSKEKKTLLEIARQEENLHVIGGVSSASTWEAIEMVQWLEKLNADAALVTQPYFSKPTQEGIFLHFEAICRNTDLPILVYNQKGRTGVNIETSTMERIAELPGIVGVKESSGDISQVADVLNEIKKYKPNFFVFSGDDFLTFPMMAMGADGVISIISNLVVSEMVNFIRAFFTQNFEQARKEYFRLLHFSKAVFIETNPIPIKAAMTLCGLPSGNPRLPLTPLSTRFISEMERIVEELGLLHLCEK